MLKLVVGPGMSSFSKRLDVSQPLVEFNVENIEPPTSLFRPMGDSLIASSF